MCRSIQGLGRKKKEHSRRSPYQRTWQEVKTTLLEIYPRIWQKEDIILVEINQVTWQKGEIRLLQIYSLSLLIFGENY